MKNRTLVIIGLVLAAVCFAVILIQGTSYTVSVPVRGQAECIEDFDIVIQQNPQIVELENQWLKDGTLYLHFRSVSQGKTYVDVYDTDGLGAIVTLYVHRSGVITSGGFFGDCSASRIIPISMSLYLVVILWTLLRRYRTDVRYSLYQYKNVKNLGLILYLCGLLLGQIPSIFSTRGVEDTIGTMLSAASFFSLIALPVAFVVSILVTVSNIRLMRREGRNWHNMLGVILGIMVCAATLFPIILGEYLQRTTLVDVHNDRGVWQYVEMAVENSVLVTVTYLEDILLATIILGLQAARKIPAFDKDYILILGCKIRADGTPTNLLKGRADRALEFARMQREATGKELIFVPSGGKGSDEVISEAESIGRYLMEAGVPPERILLEDQSANTEENIRNSAALISEAMDGKKAGIAFATTKYHVFRAGILANREGIPMEGIGSRTHSYFWINAFIREFIATVYAERRTHIRVILAMLAAALGMVYLVFLSKTL